MVLVLLGLGCRPEARLEVEGLVLPMEAADLDPAEDRVEFELVAERAPDGTYRYSGARPGPTLRAKVGDRVLIHLENRLDVPTTIHWHGVGVPNDMDGVPSVSGTVAPGRRFTYAFTVHRAGTFWYHPHFDTARQVVVHEMPESGRYRVRVLNASNTGYLWLHADGMDVSVIAGDQGLRAPSDAPPLIGPGDRVELDVGVGDGGTLLSRPWSLNGGPVTWAEPRALVRFEVLSPSAPPASPPWPYDASAPSEDPGRTDVVWTFVGSDRTNRWTINGEIFPHVTRETLPLGVPAIIEVRNVSPTEHPFHLHGFPFEVLSVNGRAPSARMFEDTLNVRIRERLRLRVVPDRSGIWMVHCHILPHADAGMMTLLEVPSAP